MTLNLGGHVNTQSAWSHQGVTQRQRHREKDGSCYYGSQTEIPERKKAKRSCLSITSYLGALVICIWPHAGYKLSQKQVDCEPPWRAFKVILCWGAEK